MKKPATKHTCGGPFFGKKTVGCPRCDELAAGGTPIKWAGKTREQADVERLAEIRRHDCKTANCGPVRTFGDW